MKVWTCIALFAFAQVGKDQMASHIGEIPTKEDCLGYIAILPTFSSEKMRAFYEMNPDASGKDLVEKMRWLADRGDKVLQFTYSQLLLNGYCVPKDVCAAGRYLEKSRGGPKNWEQIYPMQPWPKDSETDCR
jgi:hypothetical protein